MVREEWGRRERSPPGLQRERGHPPKPTGGMSDQKTGHEGEGGVPPDRELYTIPSRSSWFLWDEIHDIERSELGEFFDGTSFSRNPRVYKEYRDFIINRYREEPSRYLTFTEARRSLVGDATALHRVFLFLDRWGLINFSAAAEEPTSAAPAAAGADGGGGAFQVVVEDSPPGSVRVVPFPSAGRGMPSQPPAGAKAADEGDSFRLPPLTSYSDVFGPPAPLGGRLCGDCGEVCVSGRYESKSAFVICAKCSKNENHGVGNSADDFNFNDKKCDGGKHIASEWTDTETLSLLEAIVSKGPDWDLIANHVRRSRLECIAKFIQLPFGEHMLGSISGESDRRRLVSQRTEETIRSTPDMVQEFVKPGMQDQENMTEEHTAEESTEPPLKRIHLSLADASDSLMEKVASLSALAGPHVAAAAAGAAILALCDEYPYAKKVFVIDTNETNGTNYSFSLKNNPVSDVKVEDGETEETFKIAESTSGKNFGHLTFQIRAATATAFGAVAAHAKLLADQEDREIEYLMASIINSQLRKVRCKMKHFEVLESIMELQYAQIQQLKEDVLQQWIGISQRALSAGIPRWKDPGFHKPLPSKYTVT